MSALLVFALLLSSCAKKDTPDKPDSVDAVNNNETVTDTDRETDSSDPVLPEQGENTPTVPEQPKQDDKPLPTDNTSVTNPQQPSDNIPDASTAEDPLNGSGVTVSTAPKNDYSTLTLETFFADAAFVGDSVMYGFDLYTGRNKTVESASTFLTITSFAARHALSDVGPKSYHPSYNGVKMKVEDALALDGAKAAFIFLGLNDVRVTPNSYYENYIEFMGRIREKNPNIDLFILSTTYPVESPGSMDKATAASYRDQLQDLNVRLKAWCEEGNGYFINVVSPLLNDKGFLDTTYSSDNYVHLTNSAYAVWASTIENYINELIQNGTAPQSSLIEFTKDSADNQSAASESATPPATEAPTEPDESLPPENAENIENTTPEEV